MEVYFWVLFVITTAPLYMTTVDSQSQCNTSGSIRLEDGENMFEGRVEVCDGNTWKTVCKRQWWNKEAAVVCRQLGRFNQSTPNGNLAVPVRNIGPFGEGSSDLDIIRVKWKCHGSETSLLQCETEQTSEREPCEHDMDAGVRCYDDCSEGDIRVVDGYSVGVSGRVEICIGNYWGTVCDDGWDRPDATTVCRQLEVRTNGIPTNGAYFGEGNGPIHLSRVECRSNNWRLRGCTKDNTGINMCTHREDAGVICTGPISCIDGDVRLMGGENAREGRVEICYNGVWGTVCDYGWDQVDASVVCTELKYAGVAMVMNTFEAGDGPVLLNDVSCSQTHTRLSQCIHPGDIGLNSCQGGTAGVSCEPVISSSSTVTPQMSKPLAITTSRSSYSTSDSIPFHTLSSTFELVTSISTTNTNSTSEIFTLSTGMVTTGIAPAAVSSGVIVGAVGGVLALVAIAGIIAVFLAVFVRQRVRKRGKHGGPMDNPTYDEGINLNSMPTTTSTQERKFQNPVYFDTGPQSHSSTTQLMSDDYEGVYSEATAVSETVYENTDVMANERERADKEVVTNGGVTEGAAVTETVYDVPIQSRDSVEGSAEDNGCYSALGPKDYATLEPHITKPTQHQLAPSDDEYAHLQHRF